MVAKKEKIKVEKMADQSGGRKVVVMVEHWVDKKVFQWVGMRAE